MSGSKGPSLPSLPIFYGSSFCCIEISFVLLRTSLTRVLTYLLRRCDENCLNVDRRKPLVLCATCKTRPSDAELPCPGQVTWEAQALGVASLKRPGGLPPSQNWTRYGGRNARLTAPSRLFPRTDGYVMYEIRASGQLHLDRLCRDRQCQDVIHVKLLHILWFAT